VDQQEEDRRSEQGPVGGTTRTSVRGTNDGRGGLDQESVAVDTRIDMRPHEE
jgi:hypothetical protein